MTDHLIAAARRARAATTPRHMHAVLPAAGSSHSSAIHDRDGTANLPELKLLDDAGVEFVSVYQAGWLGLGRSIIRSGFARMRGLVR